MNGSEVLLALVLVALLIVGIAWGVSRWAYARGAGDALVSADSYRYQRQVARYALVMGEADNAEEDNQ